MHQNSDLTELLAILNAAGAEYLIVGAYAFAYHGKARATKDADIFIRPSSENASKVWRALLEFGAPMDGISVEDFSDPDVVYHMGREPNRIDVLNDIDGVSFETAWENRVAGTYGGHTVYFIGREDLIANKKAAGRPQDLLDVAYLEDGK